MTYIFLYFRKQKPLKYTLYFRNQKPSKTSYISWNGTLHFSIQAWKKKSNPVKVSYISGKWNFLTLVLKNVLHFLKRKLFLYFRKQNLKKLLIFSKEKAFLIFQKTETRKKSSLSFRKRNYLIFQEGTCKIWKWKISYITFQVF